MSEFAGLLRDCSGVLHWLLKLLGSYRGGLVGFQSCFIVLPGVLHWFLKLAPSAVYAAFVPKLR